jgi:adenylate cyclase
MPRSLGLASDDHNAGMGPDGAPTRGSTGTGNDGDAAESLKVGARQRRLRRLWRSIPAPPRCKMCHRPFGGIGGPFMRLAGLGPWPANPKYCRGCYLALYRHRDGAEVECGILFADVRGSTALAEMLPPAGFRTLMDRFYATAFGVLVEHDAFVDKFVGDEVIGIFLPAMTEGHHAREAIDAGLELLRATGHEGARPWVPVGIGVNVGVAYVGAVGTEEHVEFTALGDEVNVAARLSAAAGAGELLATSTALAAAGVSADGLEQRSLQLRGKANPTEVAVLAVTRGLSRLPAARGGR